MNVEIGAEAAQFPEKEFINGVAFAVQCIHLRFSLGFWPIPGIGETEVGHTEVVFAAVLLDAD